MSPTIDAYNGADRLLALTSGVDRDAFLESAYTELRTIRGDRVSAEDVRTAAAWWSVASVLDPHQWRDAVAFTLERVRQGWRVWE